MRSPRDADIKLIFFRGQDQIAVSFPGFAAILVSASLDVQAFANLFTEEASIPRRHIRSGYFAANNFSLKPEERHSCCVSIQPRCFERLLKGTGLHADKVNPTRCGPTALVLAVPSQRVSSCWSRRLQEGAHKMAMKIINL